MTRRLPKNATTLDYIKINGGGRPKVYQDSNGLWHIIHQYRDDQAEVVTHISPEQRGKVIINGIEYNVAELWELEGKPCTIQSRKSGSKENY